MTLEQAKQVQQYLAGIDDDVNLGNAHGLAEVRELVDAEVAKLVKRKSTKFYVVDRIVTFIRRNKKAFEYHNWYPGEEVEALLRMLDDEGWL